MPSRRRFLKSLVAAGGMGTVAGFGQTVVPRVTLGFSLYGMRSLPWAAALRACAEIGYSGVEIPLMADWPGAPESLDRPGRTRLRATLADEALDLVSLMESLTLLAPPEQHRANLDRIARAGELAHDLAPEQPPLLETILGGKTDEWPAVKAQMVDRLGEWAEAAERVKLTIAVKPHVMHALARPEDAVWLVKQVDHPALKLVFDYSHYERQAIPLAEAQRLVLPHAAFVAVKDNRLVGGRAEFALPGEGRTDYVALLRGLIDARYAGPVVVEVSSQVSSKPGYDPVRAARRAYDFLQPKFIETGLRARA